MATGSHRSPLRPRQPGERRPGSAGGLGVRWIIGLAVAIILMASAGVFLLDRNQQTSPNPAGADDPGPADTSPTADAAATSLAAHDITLALPLTLADVGFDQGTVREGTAQEGPGAPTWCGRAVDPLDGLSRWRANRLTDAGEQRRVHQLTARFDSAPEATAFVAAEAALLSCGRWDTTAEGRPVQITVGSDPGGPTVGDETRRVDLEVTGEGAPLHLRTLTIRAGTDVTLLTLVVLDAQELDPLEASVLTALGLGPG